MFNGNAVFIESATVYRSSLNVDNMTIVSQPLTKTKQQTLSEIDNKLLIGSILYNYDEEGKEISRYQIIDIMRYVLGERVLITGLFRVIR